MTRLQITETSFTSGELAPELHGRIDLKAYEDGASKLRNVRVPAHRWSQAARRNRAIGHSGSAAKLVVL